MEKIWLVSVGWHTDKIDEIKAVTEKLGIDVEVLKIKGELITGMFRIFAYLKGVAAENSILVNVGSGDNLSNCAALSAAFVNGLKAFTVIDGRLVFLPVLKFSYYRLIAEKKLAILKFLLAQPDCCSSLDELSSRLGMSLPLLSYHVNGTAKVDGLVSMGLVDVHAEAKGRIKVMLTELGRLIAEGIIET